MNLSSVKLKLMFKKNGSPERENRLNFIYNARIESTGFLRAAKNTGRNVEINATTSAIPTIIPTDTIPNTNSVTCKFISDFKIELISPQPKNAPISASTVHMPTIIPASAKKILNTSGTPCADRA